MNKIALMLTTLVVAGYVTVKMTDLPDERKMVWTDGAKIDEECLRYQCFKETLDQAVAGLGKGEISLKEAQAQVYDAATRFRPQFLEVLVWAESGGSAEERVAHNLVGHVRIASQVKPHLQPRVPLLEHELQGLIKGHGERSSRQ